MRATAALRKAAVADTRVGAIVHQPFHRERAVRNVLLGGKVDELGHPEVGLGGHLHGVKVGASAGREQMQGNFFILLRAVPNTRNN